MPPGAEYDVIIVGGGVTGAGILRDCSLRGLKAVLVEKGSFGGATTAASTHLIHGGLRYLLYDRLTTHTTCWDSGNIVRIARPLLTRLPILWPVYRGHRHGLETVETLLESYDGFSRMKEGRPHARLAGAEAAKLVPALTQEGLRGALVFDEWWVDPVGLVRANIEAARGLGAEAMEGAQVTGLLKDGRTVAGVTVRKGAQDLALRARLTINAAGPWVDRVASMAGARIPMRLRKGTHLVYEGDVLGLGRGFPAFGLLLEAQDKDRYIFVIYAAGITLVGPTDLPGPEDPDRLASDSQETRYLLASARRYFPSLPERFDATKVGARPILGQSGSEKLLSREYEIVDHAAQDGVPGLLTAAGGKLSDFRLMAQDAVDAACRLLGRPTPCRTHLLTLDGRPLGEPPLCPAPSRPLKRFLRRHPRLREWHALAYLGAAFLAHAARRILGAREGSADELRRLWPDGPSRH